MKENIISFPEETAPLQLGWREWIALPELNIDRIKVKVDTGARTSALHTIYVDSFEVNGVKKVRFSIHPLQYHSKKIVECEATVIDERWVCDSGGHREKRYVIETAMTLGNYSWPIKVTLTNRDSMRFRMLLGRTALRKACIILPRASYLCGKRKGLV